ncbi:hypothetical protein ACIQY5_19175 [Peribacillus frigoritolerans]|uniref:hypothetical protein n=1 Tax=Peribacillus frigoritolerans TaxID=450367 RepID=UPI00381F0CC3
MDADFINGLVSSGITLIVGAAGAIVAYKGTIKGAKIQIENEHKKLEDAAKQQVKFTREAIENFLTEEIKINFIKLKDNYELTNFLSKNSEPFKFGFNSNKYNYDEFNNLKYKIIEFESDETKEIINIYNMFHLTERKTDILSFTQQEFNDFKSTYDICLNKYS